MMISYQCSWRSIIIIIVACIIIGFLYQFFIVFHLGTNIIKCYRIKGESLPDILDASPSKDKSIFFHETSCKSFNNDKIVITARQACAVESAARANPNLEVYLLFTSPGLIKDEGGESDRFLNKLQTYKNIKMCHLDFEQYTKDTPLEKLYSSGKIEWSIYAISHSSDVLRFLTLWRYGGIYLDLDVVVIKSLEKIPLNYGGAEDTDYVGSSILSFDSEGLGHDLAQQCVEELRDHFNGREWAENGPRLITRLVKKVCKAKTVKKLIEKDCPQFKVYPQESFYAVHWSVWQKLFNSTYNNEVLNLTRNSYIIHVYNSMNRKSKVNVTSDDVPYSSLAKKFCPKVFAECVEFF